MRSAVCISFLLISSCLAIAQDNPTPKERLKQYVSELQKSPDDQALREKIIKLALTITSKPAPPIEADEQSGRAKYLLKNATSEADYVAAAKAFASASDLVPWEPEYYFNEGIALEKAKEFQKAIAAFKWYLMAAPDADDAKAVRERIGGLRVATEKSSEADAATERDRQKNGGLYQLRDLVKGKQYSWFTCRGEAGETGSCTWKEYLEGNWYPQKPPMTLRHWEFRGDTAILVGSDGKDLYHVRSNGPSIRDLKWEYLHDGTEWYPVPFVDVKPDVSVVIIGISFYGSPNDVPSLNPSKRFFYNMYRTQ